MLRTTTCRLLLRTGASTSSDAGAFLGGGQKAAPVAAFTPVDLQEEQRKAIGGNLANQEAIQSLTSSTNRFDQQQATELSEMALPGIGKLRSNLLKTSSDLLQNPYDLPPDVQENLARIASERGISAGTRGQFNDFSLLRDLGVNQLQYGQQRINQAGSIAGLVSSIAPKVNPMSPLSFYVTPGQSATVAGANNTGQQATTQAGNNSSTAASNFNTATWANLLSQATALGAGAIGKSIANRNAGGGGGADTSAPEYGGYIDGGGS